MTGRFDGRVALVTGGASGIGAAAAHRFAGEGATVIVADRDGEGAEAVAAKLRAEGFEAVSATCDQVHEEEVQDLFSGPVAAYDRLDVCFANAGWGRVSSFLDFPYSLWQRTIDINLNGTFLVCQAAARRMVECGNGGSIVITASSGAVVPAAFFSAYCSAKAALNMLAGVMAYELGAYDIRVNAVMPGVTETSMTKEILEAGPGVRGDIERRVPLGRLGRPEDIAATVAYLASDDASYVTGTSVLVDGGGSFHSEGWFVTDFRNRGHADWTLRQPHEGGK